MMVMLWVFSCYVSNTSFLPFSIFISFFYFPLLYLSLLMLCLFFHVMFQIPLFFPFPFSIFRFSSSVCLYISMSVSFLPCSPTYNIGFIYRFFFLFFISSSSLPCLYVCLSIRVSVGHAVSYIQSGFNFFFFLCTIFFLCVSIFNCIYLCLL